MYEFFISTLFVFTGLLSVLFVLRVWKRSRLKNTERKLRLRLSEIAKYNGLKVSESDYFQYKILAFDGSGNKFIFVDDSTSEEIIVDLEHVSECKLIQKQLSLQLELVSKDGYQESVCIPFYRRYHDSRSLRKKLSEKADYWKDIISNALEKPNANVLNTVY